MRIGDQYQRWHQLPRLRNKKMERRFAARGGVWAVAAALLACVVGVSATHAQTPEPLDRQLFAPSKGEPASWGVQPSGADDLQQQFRRELGAAAVSEESQPVLEIIQSMRQAEARLADQEAGASTQQIQAQIVADLDRMIEQAQGQAGSAASQQSTSSQTGTNPDPGEGRGGTAPSGTASPNSQQPPPVAAPLDPARVRQWMQRLWGELPDRQREQMLQSPPEEFLPAYEWLIEAYFRRLATEREAEGGVE